jgi:serine-type D-Ala-D-Ala carboxypeptidase/endopeptidase (penicillin-binding protein 4)
MTRQPRRTAPRARLGVVGAALVALVALPATTAAAVEASSVPARASATGIVDLPGRAGAALAPAGWMTRLDDLIGTAPMSVAVGRPGQLWYSRLGRSPRVPASNEKLLLAMAMLDEIGPDALVTTQVRASVLPDRRGRVDRLWLVGSGDPYTDRSDVRALARSVHAAGVRVVRGDVLAAVGPFRRDDDAPGWKAWFPDVLVPLPTALTFEGNVARDGSHLSVPEQRAAQALTAALRARGITVRGRAATGRPPGGLTRLAALSPPVTDPMGWMLQVSDNFAAEVLGKRLGWEATGTGSIAAAARTICALEHRWRVAATCNDASGLSYANRQTARGMLSMLTHAQRQSWGSELQLLLPAAGMGSLEGRLAGIDVRAKTGTLTGISALSGWVRADSDGGWVAFSLLTRGMSSDAAKVLEDKVVRLLAQRARVPG